MNHIRGSPKPWAGEPRPYRTRVGSDGARLSSAAARTLAHPCSVLLMVVLLAAGTAVGQSRPATMATTLPAILPVDFPTPAMLTEAAKSRLQAERAVYEQELSANAKYDPDDVKKVCAEMNAGAIDTVQDNLRRMARALSQLEPQFAKGWELYQAGKWSDAAEALRPLMAERVGIKQRYKHNTMSPCSYTMTKFLWSECTGQQGMMVECIIGYQVVFMEKLPENLTFSAPARYRTALMYEQSGRPHWAMPLFKDMLSKYGAFINDREALRLAAKVTALAEADPYRQATRRAVEVQKRLARAESSNITRKSQAGLIGMLEEMKKMNEVEERPFLESSQSIVWGAEGGKLEEGSAGTITLVGEDAPKVGSDDWGQLRPREKQQLMQAFNATYPERYREMLEAYYRNMSAAETNNGGSPATAPSR